MFKGDHGKAQIQIPRDRDSSFQPKIIPKGKTRIEGFKDNILALYARGMTTSNIQVTLKELYNGAEFSHNGIANVTEGVLEEVQQWPNRLLDSTYPVVFLDCIVVKVHQKKDLFISLFIWPWKYIVMAIKTFEAYGSPKVNVQNSG